MKLNRVSKFIVGALTAWPPLYMALFMGFMFLTVSAGPTTFEFFPILMGFHMATMAIIFGLLGFYTIHALKNDTLEMTPRMLWAVMFFVGGVIAMPVYYFMQILPDPPAGPRPATF